MAYLGVLLLIASLGMVAAHSVQLGSVHTSRDIALESKEMEHAFSMALQSYAAATPAGAPRAPVALEELLRDPRFPGIVRHLKSVPVDPQTGVADWKLVRDPFGRIVRISSSKPADIANP